MLLFYILGYLLFKDFCETVSEEPILQLKFYEQVSSFFLQFYVKWIE